MKRIRYLAAVFCLLLLLAGCAGEPKVKQTFEGDLASYAEMTDGTWTCDGRSYAYRLELPFSSEIIVWRVTPALPIAAR